MAFSWEKRHSTFEVLLYTNWRTAIGAGGGRPQDYPLRRPPPPILSISGAFSAGWAVQTGVNIGKQAGYSQIRQNKGLKAPFFDCLPRFAQIFAFPLPPGGDPFFVFGSDSTPLGSEDFFVAGDHICYFR